MGKYHFYVIILVCTLGPLLLLAAFVGLMVILPVRQAPSLERIAKYAKKYLKGNPVATRSELRRHLRDRFTPDWASQQPPNNLPVLLFWGVLVFALTSMLQDLRSHFVMNRIYSRIDRVVDAVEWD